MSNPNDTVLLVGPFKFDILKREITFQKSFEFNISEREITSQSSEVEPVQKSSEVKIVVASFPKRDSCWLRMLLLLARHPDREMPAAYIAEQLSKFAPEQIEVGKTPNIPKHVEAARKFLAQLSTGADAYLVGDKRSGYALRSSVDDPRLVW